MPRKNRTHKWSVYKTLKQSKDQIFHKYGTPSEDFTHYSVTHLNDQFTNHYTVRVPLRFSDQILLYYVQW